jgi:hypothetical protein
MSGNRQIGAFAYSVACACRVKLLTFIVAPPDGSFAAQGL